MKEAQPKQGPTATAKITLPTKSILDKTFKYVRAAETDIRKTFKKVKV